MSDRSGPIQTTISGGAKHVGRIGALAVALGVGMARRNATRVTVSIGVAALVAAAAAVPVSTDSPAVNLSADSTALLLCGISCPTWNDAHVEEIKNQFVAPTHPGQDIDYVAVTTPSEVWPLTGAFRALGLLGLGEPGCARPSGDCWPDYPLWKLSGLFDLTYDQSVAAGVADLEAAMAAAGNDHLVIFGDDQGANVANVMKRKLAEQYPNGTVAPDIDFVLTGDANVPNGGLHARFPGFYVPIGWTFDGPELTNTQFDTDVVIRQYDGIADFPMYPLNPVATLNALLGVIYVHPFFSDVSLPPDPTTSPAYQGTHGDSSYYFFETQDLPLFGPLRTLGVPESLIDVVEPFFRVLVEAGYDRTIAPWQPTPARLIPPLDPAKLITDLGNAIGEGVTNAAALIGAPAALHIPAPATLATPADEAAGNHDSPQLRSTQTGPPTNSPTQTEQLDSIDHATTNGQASAKTAPTASEDTGTTQADEEVSGPTAARVASPSDLASPAERVKPTLRPVTPRLIVRESLDASNEPRGVAHGSNGSTTSTSANTPTTGTTAVDATTRGVSSASSESTSPTAEGSSAGGSSGDVAGESE